MKKFFDKIKEGFLRDVLAETRWIYRYARKFKSGIIWYVILGLISTGIGLFAGITTKYALDGVLSKNLQLLISFGILYIVTGLLKIILSAVLKRFAHKISLKAQNDLRESVFSRFLDMDWQASLDYHSGDLLSRVQSDVNTVADSILGWIPSLVLCSAQFIGALVIILVYDPVMGLISLVSAPFTVIISRVFIKKMRTFGQKVRDEQARLTSFCEESLSNLQAVKSFHLNERMSDRLASLQKMYWNTSMDYNLFSVKTGFLLSLLGFISGGLCLLWGVYELWTGKITAGSMVLFIQLAGALASSFSSLIAIFPSVITSTVSAGRIMKILDLPMEKNEPTEKEEELLSLGKETGVTVSAEHLDFAYGEPGSFENENPVDRQTTVFQDFSFSAAPGEIIGIVGASGDGKTTLLRLILSLISPQRGTLTVSADHLTLPVSPALRPLFSVVSQEKYMTAGTVREVLSIVNPYADDEEMYAALKLAEIDDVICSHPDSLDTVISEKGAGFSEGQIQRIAIARAILQDAPVLLLDEATSALDFETEKRVIENIVKHCNGKTVIVTTHRPQILEYCTRVYRV